MDKSFTYGQLLSVLTLADKGAGSVSTHDLVSHILRLPEKNPYDSGYIPDIQHVMKQAKEKILEQYPDIRNAVEAYCEALKIHHQLNESCSEQAYIDNYMMELEKIKDGSWSKDNSAFLSVPVRFGLDEYKDPETQEKAIKQYKTSIKRKCAKLDEHWMDQEGYDKLIVDTQEAVQRVNRLYGVLEKALIQHFDMPEHKTYDPRSHVKYDTRINASFEQISDAKLAELKIDFKALKVPVPKEWGKPQNSVDAGGAKIDAKVSKKPSGWSRGKSSSDNNTSES